MHSIWILLAAGFVLRICFAATSLTVVYPDEHFQILEPANWVINGFGWKSWEWYHGVRSWFVPSLYMPLLALLKILGIQGGPVSIYACRIFTSLFSCAALWQFWILLKQRGLGVLSQVVALGLLAFSGTMVVWSATTFTETWVFCALWIAMPTVIRNLKSNDIKKWIIAGALMGITFPMRIQALPWAGTLGILLLLTRKERKIFPFYILGFLIPVTLQGLLDWLTWGYPYYSSYKYIKVAVLGGVVDSNGVSPWYTYFSTIGNNLGILFWCSFFVLMGLGFISRKIRWLKEDFWIVFPAVMLVASHMLIGHKEMRFVMPIYPVFFYLIAIGVEGITLRWFSICSWIRKKLSLFAVSIACIVFSVVCWHFRFSSDHFPTNEMGDLSRLVYEDGGLRGTSEPCILLVDHYWVWTRGEMILGQKVKFIEKRSADIGETELQECSYALMQSWSEKFFRDRWIFVGKDRWGNSVYKRPG